MGYVSVLAYAREYRFMGFTAEEEQKKDCIQYRLHTGQHSTRDVLQHTTWGKICDRYIMFSLMPRTQDQVTDLMCPLSAKPSVLVRGSTVRRNLNTRSPAAGDSQYGVDRRSSAHTPGVSENTATMLQRCGPKPKSKMMCVSDVDDV
jgi:hypothetical protein